MIFVLLVIFVVLYLFAFIVNMYFLVVFKNCGKVYSTSTLIIRKISCFHCRIIETVSIKEYLL